jgi:carboxypeptidase Q
MKLKVAVRTCLLLVAPVLVWGADTADLAVVHRIKAEAFERSRVMDHMFYLADVYGPHLPNTPAFTAVGDWAVKRLQEYGLVNVAKEKWGPFGRGWSYSRFSAHMLEPQYAPLEGFPLAWSEPTKGRITGEPVLAPIRDASDFEKYKGKLKGKIVMSEPARAIGPHFTPDASRLTEAELTELAMLPDPASAGFRGRGPRVDYTATINFRQKINEFLRNEGVLAVLTPGRRGDDGTVFGQQTGSREVKEPLAPTTVALSTEQYNRMVRLIEKKIPVRVELEVASQIHQETLDSFNVVAEIPGGSKKDEIVMLGGHLDTWQGGTGATDDGAGSAVVMEVVRILKALDLKMDRTVRVALWSAEEEGLLGSRAYVKQHFADPETMALKPEHAKLAGYFNLDNGGGKIRGVYTQGNDMMRPIFAAWLEPFRDLGVSTVTNRITESTDHISFEAVGLPGFQFIQDSLDYGTRSHHSNMDVYDRLQPGDLMQASAVIASLVYHTAVREQMLPRKPLPLPLKR